MILFVDLYVYKPQLNPSIKLFETVVFEAEYINIPSFSDTSDLISNPLIVTLLAVTLNRGKSGVLVNMDVHVDPFSETILTSLFTGIVVSV